MKTPRGGFFPPWVKKYDVEGRPTHVGEVALILYPHGELAICIVNLTLGGRRDRSASFPSHSWLGLCCHSLSSCLKKSSTRPILPLPPPPLAIRSPQSTQLLPLLSAHSFPWINRSMDFAHEKLCSSLVCSNLRPWAEQQI